MSQNNFHIVDIPPPHLRGGVEPEEPKRLTVREHMEESFPFASGGDYKDYYEIAVRYFFGMMHSDPILIPIGAKASFANGYTWRGLKRPVIVMGDSTGFERHAVMIHEMLHVFTRQHHGGYLFLLHANRILSEIGIPAVINSADQAALWPQNIFKRYEGLLELLSKQYELGETLKVPDDFEFIEVESSREMHAPSFVDLQRDDIAEEIIEEIGVKDAAKLANDILIKLYKGENKA